MNFVAFYQKLERTLGGLKFAVVIITIFATYLVYGTFMESYHGVEYANRLVYKSWPFMLVQGGMFLSILCAALLRLPPKKPLYGFYVIHLGLLILFLGSFITYQTGVDGNLTLLPNTPARNVKLNRDQLVIQLPSQNRQASINLPYSSGEKKLDLEWEGVKLVRFLPFAEKELQWLDILGPANPGRQHSARYQLANDNFTETIVLSLYQDADYPNTTQLGPLSVHYMPEQIADCFAHPDPAAPIIWDVFEGACFVPEPNEIKKQTGVGGKTKIELTRDGEKLIFLPEMSPLPVDEKLQVRENTGFRVFSRTLFQEKPHLFTFGTKTAFFNKEDKKWHLAKLAVGGEAVELPWMGFKLKLLDFYEDKYPKQIPTPVTPIQDNGNLITGGTKAVELEIEGVKFWLNDRDPLTFTQQSGMQIKLELAKEELRLPFEITLDNFKMDTDPGTNNPASYESFVSLFKGDEGSEQHHVYMNHPLKYQTFTFYQASYFQTNQGPYGSVFSVNYDPGRPWKYLGSLLLVLGSIWHYQLRRRRKPTTT